MELPVVHDAELRKLLPMEAAIDAIEDVFGRQKLPDAPARSHFDVGSGDLLLMPAWGDDGVGIKLVTVNPSNPAAGLPLINGIYVLFAAHSLQPVMIVDAAGLTGIRTAAVSGVATRHLARADCKRLVIFGAGIQARYHLEAMLAVRPIEEVTCVSRSGWRAEEFVAWAKGFGRDVRLGNPDAVGSADIVCTCTTSKVPVFDGSKLAGGAHVNAIGAYEPDARELDDKVIARSRLVVETRPAALAEAGDLKIPITEGTISPADIVADLADVVSGVLVRRSAKDITVFKSVGVAIEDLAVARALFERINA